MRIPLDVRMYSEGLKPFVTVHLKIPKQKVRGSIIRGIFWPFIDTGSPFTVISQTDAERLRIKYSGKPRKIWFGGAQLHSYDVKGVELKVVYEDRKTICDISMPTIGVIQPIPNVKLSYDVAKAIPSVIGVDLLKRHRFALYFDAHNEISYLEKVQKINR